MINCCKDCVPPDRHPGCHSTCKEYINQNKKHIQEREDRRRIKNIYDDFNDYEIKRIERNKKKRAKTYGIKE